ncbi:MAG TPA: FAD-dependent oxidoreductase [Mycobacterium sp.]
MSRHAECGGVNVPADTVGTAPHAVIAGAGLAGLTAAYRLHTAGWDVDIIEAGEHAGGRVETVHAHGYAIDTGATALAARYPMATQLAEELGIERIWTAPYLGIYRSGRIRLLRLDRLLRSGLTTDLLGSRTKLRLIRVVIDIIRASVRAMLSYEDLRRAAPLDTETARDYLRRAAGIEADAYFGEPLTRALLLANSDQVSRVELMSGLINAVAGRLSTLAGGQGRLVRSPVHSVHRTTTGVQVGYTKPDGSPAAVDADACIVATTLPDAATICGDEVPALNKLAQSLRFTRAINVAIGTTRPARTPAFLVQLPSDEDPEIAMIIVENNKAPDRAPPGHGLLSVSWEMSAATAWFGRSDAELVERALVAVFRILPELRGTVDFTYVRRWPLALPHTRVGVYREIAAFTSALDPNSPIQFAGDYLSQTGQNTAVAWANRAAANLTGNPPIHARHRTNTPGAPR